VFIRVVKETTCWDRLDSLLP